MMKISRFSIGEPDSSGEMSGDVDIKIGNPTAEDVRWVQYRAAFEDAQGFPLYASNDNADDCRVEPNEDFQVSVPCTLQTQTAGTGRRDIVVRASVTLHAREFFRLGEIDIPASEFGCATVSQTIQSAVLDSKVMLLAVRARNDDEGQGRVECRVVLTNRSTLHLERVELKCELLDADEAVVDSSDDACAVPAGAVACIEGGIPWVRASQLRRGKIRLSLSVFRPVYVGSCMGMSVPQDGDGASLEDEELDEGDVDEVVDDVETEDTDSSDPDSEESSDDDDDNDDDDGSDDDDSDGDDALSGLDPGVASVLESAGAIEVAEAFLSNQITDDVIGSLTDSDLVEIGVAALGMRKRILAEIASLGQPGKGVGRKKPASGGFAPAPRRETDWGRVVAMFSSTLGAFDRVMVLPMPKERKLAGALEYVPQVHRGLMALVLYDDTFFSSGKDGMLVSDLGIHWRNSYKDPGFTPWSALHAASAKGKSVQLEPGGEISCAYGGAKCALALATFVDVAAGAAMAASADSSHPQRDELREALLEMRGVDEDGFVIAEDPVSGWFVQFCNGVDGPVLDIPLKKKTPLEWMRAEGFLTQCGFPEADTDSESSQREYEDDAMEEMLSDAIRALQGIYRLRPGIPLRISKGWE
jgi:hypothetical protein